MLLASHSQTARTGGHRTRVPAFLPVGFLSDGHLVASLRWERVRLKRCRRMLDRRGFQRPFD